VDLSFDEAGDGRTRDRRRLIQQVNDRCWRSENLDRMWTRVHELEGQDDGIVILKGLVWMRGLGIVVMMPAAVGVYQRRVVACRFYVMDMRRRQQRQRCDDESQTRGDDPPGGHWWHPTRADGSAATEEWLNVRSEQHD
jgi:hypothetical protein